MKPDLAHAPTPWLDALVESPADAMRDLLSGAASLGPLSAAEPADAVHHLIGKSAKDDPLRVALDDGCLEVLEDYRTTIQSRRGDAFSIALAELYQFQSIITRLLPPRTVSDLHARYPLWHGFFETFVIDRGLDLRREYYRGLALSQDIAAEAGQEPRRLMPLWLSICGESGGAGAFDKSYLRIGLLGLRRLPLGAAFSANENFALQGLARWAASAEPSEAEFMREWRVLENDFPRDADFWTSRVQQAIISVEADLTRRNGERETSFPAAVWWREDVDINPGEMRLIGGAAEPPTREEHQQVLRDIGEPLSTLAPRLDPLMRGYRRYTDKTGDMFHLVRSHCNVGMKLITTGPKSERKTRGQRAIRLAETALAHDGTHVYAWALLRDALSAANRFQDAELVGWETIRRFPENVQWRTQLATLLAGPLDRPEEAADLLRETMAVFPKNPVPRTQLATLLAGPLVRPDEAADLLRETMAGFRENPFVRTQLATVLADDLQALDQSREVLRIAIADGASDDATDTLLRKLDRGQRLRGPQRSRSKRAEADESNLSLPAAEARRLLFRFEAGRVDVAEVRTFLANQGTDGYLAYVGTRTGAVEPPRETGFAVAFERALQAAEPSALRALVAQARPMEHALIDQAIAQAEGRVVRFGAGDENVVRLARTAPLANTLDQLGTGQQVARKRLLRDVAGSLLGAGLGFSIAA